MRPLILASLVIITSITAQAQIGIGAKPPKAFLHVAEGKTVLFGGDTSGTGNKFIWYGNKGAFRAGAVTIYSFSPGNQWDSQNVGINSFASGSNTIASGQYLTATGLRTTASGHYSTAMGYYTTASGNFSTALGSRVNTNYKTGSFVIGDSDASFTDLVSDDDHQFMARFANGYKLFTRVDLSIGAYLGPGQSAWSTLSDSSRKERFYPADGITFLRKIKDMKLGSWNYKGQNYRLSRHYGPMAQDFFAAFGYDGLGTVGDDKNINQADFDGVNLIAIKALIEEVEKLKIDNQTLRSESASLRSDIEQIKKVMLGSQITILKNNQ